MKRILIAALLALSLTASANAADLSAASTPSNDSTTAPSTWAGFYFGGNLGWGQNATDTTNTYTAYAGSTALGSDTSANAKPNGAFGGAQFGYNIQRGVFLLGIETDIQGGGISDNNSVTSATYAIPGTVSENVDLLGTLRARAGLALGKSLVYVTGGFAYGHVKDTVNIANLINLTGDGVRTGYVLGAGYEYKLSNAWSTKLEYQYINLGKDPAEFDLAAYSLKTNDIEHDFHAVRLGLNYHIDSTFKPLD